MGKLLSRIRLFSFIIILTELVFIAGFVIFYFNDLFDIQSNETNNLNKILENPKEKININNENDNINNDICICIKNENQISKKRGRKKKRRFKRR